MIGRLIQMQVEFLMQYSNKNDICLTSDNVVVRTFIRDFFFPLVPNLFYSGVSMDIWICHGGICYHYIIHREKTENRELNTFEIV